MDGDADEWKKKFEELQKDETKFIRAITAWWLKIVTVIEIKRNDDKDILEHIIQLMSYLRQVLVEQLDRWFVPGLLLTGTQLAVWVADRSGALGTHKSFNIHEDPKKFIQVILGCSILPPRRLGFDPTMKLWRGRSLEPIHSFCQEIKHEHYSGNVYKRQWVIEMPAKGNSDERELFLTTKALSVVKAGCMQGRATVVWAARKLADLKPGGADT
ncbi:hypothetical protein C0991_010416, partial [Blastosporella zonata]